MNVKNKPASDATLNDLRFLERAPKKVLFAIAKHLAAAACDEGYESALESQSYLERMRHEWELLHSNGIVPQQAPRTVDKRSTA